MKQCASGLLAVLCFFAGGCATSPIPPGYSGPVAKIFDYSYLETTARAAFFFVSEVNGKPIETSLDATRRANYGRGFTITPLAISRAVPATTLTLKLEGRNAYGAPIQEIIMAATMRSVTEVIQADLKPDVSYQVRGILSDSKAEVWLEVLGTPERIGRKAVSP